MGDFKYKQYTPEEDMIYEEAMAKIREGINNGLSFQEACSSIDVKDLDLKAFILSDALKILIAEMHYAKGTPLAEVAASLKVPMNTINVAVNEMLEDAGTSAAEAYREMNPQGPVGNA